MIFRVCDILNFIVIFIIHHRKGIDFMFKEFNEFAISKLKEFMIAHIDHNIEYAKNNKFDECPYFGTEYIYSMHVDGGLEPDLAGFWEGNLNIGGYYDEFYPKFRAFISIIIYITQKYNYLYNEISIDEMVDILNNHYEISGIPDRVDPERYAALGMSVRDEFIEYFELNSLSGDDFIMEVNPEELSGEVPYQCKFSAQNNTQVWHFILYTEFEDFKYSLEL